MRGPVVIGGDNLPSPVGIGLTDLPNIGGGASGPLGPPGSGITVEHKVLLYFRSNLKTRCVKNNKVFRIKVQIICRVLPTAYVFLLIDSNENVSCRRLNFSRKGAVCKRKVLHIITQLTITLILFYKQHMIKKTSWTLLDFLQSLLIQKMYT